MINIRNWRFWAGLGISLFFLVLLVYSVDLRKVTNALGEANYVYAFPAIGLYFIAVYFRSLRWQFLIAPLRTLPISRLYPVVIIGLMANNLLPARLGELVRSYLLAQQEKISGSSTLATVAVERIYDGVTLLAFAAVSAPVLLLLGKFDETGETYRTTAIALAVGVVGVFLMALAVLTLATFRWFLRVVDLVLRLVPAGLRPGARDLILKFINGLSVLSSPRKHLIVFILSLPVWLLEGAIYLLIAYSFGIESFFDSFWILLLAIVLLTATSNLITALPTSIGGIGPFEVVAQQTLVALGVGASVGAIYAGFLHVVALWIPVNLVGLVLLWKNNLSLRRLTRTGPVAGPKAGTGYGSGFHQANEEAL